MFARVETLHSASGARLAWRFQPAGSDTSLLEYSPSETSPSETMPTETSAFEKGVLILSHGLSEHSGRYRRFAEYMAMRGFHVYAHDHRGHGMTRSVDAPLGRFAEVNGIDKVLDDLRTIRDMAAGRHPGLPIVLFGHSMGGLIALNAAERQPELYDCLALWNANFNPGLSGRAAQLILAIEKMLKGSDVPSGMLSRLTFDAWSASIPDRKTDLDWLSHDPVEVARYIDDPLCGFDISVSLWIDLFHMAFGGARLDRLNRLPRDMPIHLVGGGEDPATNGGREMRWLARRMSIAGLTKITTIVYPAMRHETLNEIGRESAMRDFADWCLKVSRNHIRAD